MVTKEQIKRINELYKKQQGEGLTDAEKVEQKELRQLYIDAMKESLRSQIKNLKIVTPEEYEKTKKNRECHDEDCSCHREN